MCVVAGVDVPATPEVEAMEPEVRKQALEATTSEVLGALFADPTLLVFNDVQFMDEATTDLLDRLAADTPSRSWLIVAARLPDRRLAAGACRPHDLAGAPAAGAGAGRRPARARHR